MSSITDMMTEIMEDYMIKFAESLLLRNVIPPEDGSDDTSSSGEEEGGHDSDPQSSKSHSSDEETEAGSFSDAAENRQTLENLKSPIQQPKFDPKSASRGNELDSDANSKRIPSNYATQPIPKGPVSSPKRSRNETDGDLSRRCQKSRIEEKKSVEESVGTQAATRKAEGTAESRAPASMPEDPILASFVRVKAQRKLLNTIKSLSACQDPQQRSVLQGLINQLCCQLGLK